MVGAAFFGYAVVWALVVIAAPIESTCFLEIRPALRASLRVQHSLYMNMTPNTTIVAKFYVVSIALTAGLIKSLSVAISASTIGTCCQMHASFAVLTSPAAMDIASES